MVTIKIHAEPGARIPAYQSKGASGADIFAFIQDPVVLQPGEIKLIPTGITLLNTPGTIDSDYRGEIKIIVTNFGKKEFSIENGMRIAQMVFNKIYKGDFIIAGKLSETDRHDGGFGHSGV